MGSNEDDNGGTLSSLHIVNRDEKSYQVSVEVFNSDESVHSSSHSIPAKDGSVAGSKKVENDWPDVAGLRIEGTVEDGASKTAELDLQEIGSGEYNINLLIEESSPSFWMSGV